jgi:uncharacterized protein YbjT (DUF2867 family)/membrane protease YdiL (CAAX protease family)
MKVLVAGSSGFVGSRLTPALEQAGHTVSAMTRDPENYHGGGEPVRADVTDADSLVAAAQGCDVAYYLVHSLDKASFAAEDAAAARTFGTAVAEAGVRRIVYLGGLGRDGDDLSAHLRSRRDVETLLGLGGVPVTTLRAGIIVGHGGISWEMTRQLVEHLPAMVTPRWVRTKTQPIAVADVVRYLVAVLDVPEAVGRVFEIGGPDVLEYVEMMRRVAALEGRKRLVIPVPLLTPALSALWLAFVTDVDTRTGRSLVDSMKNEVIVHDDSIRALIPFEPMDYDAAVLQALGERAKSARGVSSDTRRKGVVAAVAVVGAGLLGASLSTEPDSRRFYGLSAAVAGTWVVGGLASGPIHLGFDHSRRGALRRPIVEPVAIGAGAFAAFYGAALVARRVPVLNDAIASVLQYADRGSDPLVLATTLANGLGEEVFFRGALFDAVGARHPIAASTAVYTVSAAATRNPALVLASTVMGALFAGQRRATGGVLAPILTHLTWSTLMLRFLPPLFRRTHAADPAPHPTAATAG